MKKPKHSEHCSLGADRIGQLPENVIDKILTSLPIVEAAKTAVLSKNWKRRWRNISVLKFDGCFASKFEKADRRDLMLAIWQTLFLHLGAIDGFTLSILGLESCPEINPPIQFLSDKKVKHLKIHLIDGGFHVLPSYLFSCLQLCTLELTGCEFNTPHGFGGFSQLITLDFNEVYITSDFFGMFISNCPLLQQLRLQQCSFREVSSISIIAPNLRTFFYHGCKLFICIASAPLLDQLTLFVDFEHYGARCPNFKEGKKLYLNEFCASLPALRKLEMNYYFFKTLEVCNLSGESPNCLLQLEDLSISDVLFADTKEVSTLVGLIRSLPNLERLTIWMVYDDVDGQYNDLGTEEYDFSCNKLQTVELFHLNGTNAEMNFIKSLLLKSPQLKKMTIRCVEEEDELQILRKMVQFHRASVGANIIIRERINIC